MADSFSYPTIQESGARLSFSKPNQKFYGRSEPTYDEDTGAVSYEITAQRYNMRQLRQTVDRFEQIDLVRNFAITPPAKWSWLFKTESDILMRHRATEGTKFTFSMYNFDDVDEFNKSKEQYSKEGLIRFAERLDRGQVIEGSDETPILQQHGKKIYGTITQDEKQRYRDAGVPEDKIPQGAVSRETAMYTGSEVLGQQMSGSGATGIFGYVPQFGRNPDNSTNFLKFFGFSAYQDIQTYTTHPALLRMEEDFERNYLRVTSAEYTDPSVPGYSLLQGTATVTKSASRFASFKEIAKSLTDDQLSNIDVTAYIGGPTIGLSETDRLDNEISRVRKQASVSIVESLIAVSARGADRVIFNSDKSRTTMLPGMMEALSSRDNVYFRGTEGQKKEQHANVRSLLIKGSDESVFKELEEKGISYRKLGDDGYIAGFVELTTARTIGSQFYEAGQFIDVGQADDDFLEFALGIQTLSTEDTSFFKGRRDPFHNNRAAAYLASYYQPTFKDLGSSEFSTVGALPIMPTNMGSDFFKYYPVGMGTTIYSGRYRALYGEDPEDRIVESDNLQDKARNFAASIQGKVLRNMDAKLSDPGLGMWLNAIGGSATKDLYTPGEGLFGFAASAIGRTLDTISGFYAFQQMQRADKGDLDGGIGEYLDLEGREFYARKTDRGFFENLLNTLVVGVGGTAISMASYFGVTHAYSIAKAQVEESGTSFLIDVISGNNKGVSEQATEALEATLLNSDYQGLNRQARALSSALKGTAFVSDTFEVGLKSGLEEYLPAVRELVLLETFKDDTESLAKVLSDDLGIAKVYYDYKDGTLSRKLIKDVLEQDRDLYNKIDEFSSDIQTVLHGATPGVRGQSSNLFINYVAWDYHQRLGKISPDKLTRQRVFDTFGETLRSAGMDYIKTDESTTIGMDLTRTFSDPMPATNLGIDFAGFQNVGRVRRLDTVNITNMFLPLLMDAVDIRSFEEEESFFKAVGQLMSVVTSKPKLLYRRAGNESSTLTVVNYGFDRIEKLAIAFDALSSHLPANPFMWVKPIRDAFGSENVPTAKFRDLIGPGFSGLLGMQKEMARKIADMSRLGITRYLESSFKLFQQQYRQANIERKIVLTLRKKAQGVTNIAEMITNELNNNDSELKKLMNEVGGLYKQSNTLINELPHISRGLDSPKSAGSFTTFRKLFFSVGSVLIADRLLDTFVFRPQGADLIDSIMSDTFGALAPRNKDDNDASRASAYNSKYSAGIPAGLKYGAAALGYTLGGYIFPSIVSGQDTGAVKAINRVYKEGVADNKELTNLVSKTLNLVTDEGASYVTLLKRNKVSFGYYGAFIGASLALIATQIGVGVLANTAQPIVRLGQTIISGLVGSPNIRDTKDGLEVNPVEATAATILSEITTASVKRDEERGRSTRTEHAARYIAGMMAGSYMNSIRPPGREFYPFATQIASPFFQFATVGKVDPSQGQITLQSGLQLFPLLGVGLMVPSMFSPQVKYNPTIGEKRILDQIVEASVNDRGLPNQRDEKAVDIWQTLRFRENVLSFALAGGFNPTFDHKPLMFIGGMTALQSIDHHFRKVATGSDIPKWARTEMDGLKDLYHITRSGLNLTDRMVRGAYSLSISGMNAALKSTVAITGYGAQTLHRMGPLARTVAPYYLTAALISNMLRPGGAHRETDVDYASELLERIDARQVLNTKAIHQDSLAQHLINTGIGTAIFGTALHSSGAFAHLSEFSEATDSTYIGRTQQQLYGMYLEHLEGLGITADQAVEAKGILREIVNRPTADHGKLWQQIETLRNRMSDGAYKSMLQDIQEQLIENDHLDEHHLRRFMDMMDTADLPLVKSAPLRLSLASRRVAPLLLGTFAAAQFLALTDFYDDSGISSLVRAISDTGKGDYTYEQRKFMQQMGIKGSRYQPKSIQDALGNIGSYIVQSALFLQSNPVGVYQDDPNPFLGVFGPMGVSQMRDTMKTYMQSQSVGADISTSVYIMPALVSELYLSKELGPLMMAAKESSKTGQMSAATAIAIADMSMTRRKAAQTKGGPSMSEFSALSSPTLQMALRIRNDTLRNLRWQTGDQLNKGFIQDMVVADRVAIPNVKLNPIKTKWDYVLSSFSPEILDPFGLTIRYSNQDRELLTTVRALANKRAVHADMAETLYSYERVQDKAPNPITSYFTQILSYAYGTIYDEGLETYEPKIGQMLPALATLAGGAILAGSLIGSTAVSGLQVASAIASLQTYGTISDSAESLTKMRKHVTEKLKGIYFKRLIDDAETVYLVNGLQVGSHTVKGLRNEAFRTLQDVFGIRGKVGTRLTDFTSDLQAYAQRLSKARGKEVTEILEEINTRFNNVLGVTDSAQGDVIKKVFNLTDGSSGLNVFNTTDLEANITSLQTGVADEVLEAQIETRLQRTVLNSLDPVTQINSFNVADKPELLDKHSSDIDLDSSGSASKSAYYKARQATADVSSKHINDLIKKEGYSGLVKKAGGGVYRLGMGLSTFKELYEFGSYAVSTLAESNELERRRSAYAAGTITFQTFAMILPAQALINVITKNPAILLGSLALATAVGAGAMHNKPFRKAVGNTFMPVFRGIDKNVVKPTVRTIAGIYEAAGHVGILRTLASIIAPVTGMLDPMFVGARERLGRSPHFNWLAELFIPETKDAFFERLSESVGFSTAYGPRQELYSTGEYKRYRDNIIKARRERANRPGSGISETLLHPFLQGRMVSSTLRTLQRQRLSGSNRVNAEFLSDAMLTNTQKLAILRRQQYIDSYINGMMLARLPDEKPNATPMIAMAAAPMKYSLATTGSLVDAPVMFASRIAKGTMITSLAIAEVMSKHPNIRNTGYGVMTGLVVSSVFFNKIGYTSPDKHEPGKQGVVASVGIVGGGALGYGSSSIGRTLSYFSTKYSVISRLGVGAAIGATVVYGLAALHNRRKSKEERWKSTPASVYWATAGGAAVSSTGNAVLPLGVKKITKLATTKGNIVYSTAQKASEVWKGVKNIPTVLKSPEFINIYRNVAAGTALGALASAGIYFGSKSIFYRDKEVDNEKLIPTSLGIGLGGTLLTQAMLKEGHLGPSLVLGSLAALGIYAASNALFEKKEDEKGFLRGAISIGSGLTAGYLLNRSILEFSEPTARAIGTLTKLGGKGGGMLVAGAAAYSLNHFLLSHGPVRWVSSAIYNAMGGNPDEFDDNYATAASAAAVVSTSYGIWRASSVLNGKGPGGIKPIGANRVWQATKTYVGASLDASTLYSDRVPGLLGKLVSKTFPWVGRMARNASDFVKAQALEHFEGGVKFLDNVSKGNVGVVTSQQYREYLDITRKPSTMMPYGRAVLRAAPGIIDLASLTTSMYQVQMLGSRGRTAKEYATDYQALYKTSAMITAGSLMSLSGSANVGLVNYATTLFTVNSWMEILGEEAGYRNYWVNKEDKRLGGAGAREWAMASLAATATTYTTANAISGGQLNSLIKSKVPLLGKLPVATMISRGVTPAVQTIDYGITLNTLASPYYQRYDRSAALRAARTQADLGTKAATSLTALAIFNSQTRVGGSMLRHGVFRRFRHSSKFVHWLARDGFTGSDALATVGVVATAATIIGKDELARRTHEEHAELLVKNRVYDRYTENQITRQANEKAANWSQSGALISFATIVATGFTLLALKGKGKPSQPLLVNAGRALNVLAKGTLGGAAGGFASGYVGHRVEYRRAVKKYSQGLSAEEFIESQEYIDRGKRAPESYLGAKQFIRTAKQQADDVITKIQKAEEDNKRQEAPIKGNTSLSWMHVDKSFFSKGVYIDYEQRKREYIEKRSAFTPLDMLKGIGGSALLGFGLLGPKKGLPFVKLKENLRLQNLPSFEKIKPSSGLAGKAGNALTAAKNIGGYALHVALPFLPIALAMGHQSNTTSTVEKQIKNKTYTVYDTATAADDLSRQLTSYGSAGSIALTSIVPGVGGNIQGLLLQVGASQLLDSFSGFFQKGEFARNYKFREKHNIKYEVSKEKRAQQAALDYMKQKGRYGNITAGALIALDTALNIRTTKGINPTERVLGVSGSVGYAGGAIWNFGVQIDKAVARRRAEDVLLDRESSVLGDLTGIFTSLEVYGSGAVAAGSILFRGYAAYQGKRFVKSLWQRQRAFDSNVKKQLTSRVKPEIPKAAPRFVAELPVLPKNFGPKDPLFPVIPHPIIPTRPTPSGSVNVLGTMDGADIVPGGRPISLDPPATPTTSATTPPATSVTTPTTPPTTPTISVTAPATPAPSPLTTPASTIPQPTSPMTKRQELAALKATTDSKLKAIQPKPADSLVIQFDPEKGKTQYFKPGTDEGVRGFNRLNIDEVRSIDLDNDTFDLDEVAEGLKRKHGARKAHWMAREHGFNVEKYVKSGLHINDLERTGMEFRSSEVVQNINEAMEEAYLIKQERLIQAEHDIEVDAIKDRYSGRTPTSDDAGFVRTRRKADSSPTKGLYNTLTSKKRRSSKRSRVTAGAKRTTRKLTAGKVVSELLGGLSYLELASGVYTLATQNEDFERSYGYQSIISGGLGVVATVASKGSSKLLAKAIPGLNVAVDATEGFFGVQRLNMAETEEERQQAKEDIGGAIGSAIGGGIGGTLAWGLGALFAIPTGGASLLLSAGLTVGFSFLGDWVGRRVVRHNKFINKALDVFDADTWWNPKENPDKHNAYRKRIVAQRARAEQHQAAAANQIVPINRGGGHAGRLRRTTKGQDPVMQEKEKQKRTKAKKAAASYSLDTVQSKLGRTADVSPTSTPIDSKDKKKDKDEAKDPWYIDAYKKSIDWLNSRIEALHQWGDWFVETAGSVITGATIGSNNLNEHELLIADILAGAGFNKFGIAAALGTFRQESRLNPQARNPSSGAFGIAQWLGARQTNMPKPTGDRKTDITNQTNYFLAELRGKNNEGQNGALLKTLQNAQSLDEAMGAMNAYERFSGWQRGRRGAEAGSRYEYGEGYLGQFQLDNGAVINNQPMGATGNLGVGLNLPERREFGSVTVTLPGQGKVTVTDGYFDGGHGRSPGKANISAIFGNSPQTIQTFDARGLNLGIDYVVPDGKVKSLTGGRVAGLRDAGSSGYGKQIIIETDLLYKYKGQSYRLWTHYAHMDSMEVKQGQSVSQGTYVGRMGNTGASHGAHVDNPFWFMLNGKKVYVSPNIIFGENSSDYVIKSQPQQTKANKPARETSKVSKTNERATPTTTVSPPVSKPDVVAPRRDTLPDQGGGHAGRNNRQRSSVEQKQSRRLADEGILIASAGVSDMGGGILPAQPAQPPQQLNFATQPEPELVARSPLAGLTRFLNKPNTARIQQAFNQGMMVRDANLIDRMIFMVDNAMPNDKATAAGMDSLEVPLNSLFRTNVDIQYRAGKSSSLGSYINNRIFVNSSETSAILAGATLVHEYTHAVNSPKLENLANVKGDKQYGQQIMSSLAVSSRTQSLDRAQRHYAVKGAVGSSISYLTGVYGMDLSKLNERLSMLTSFRSVSTNEDPTDALEKARREAVGIFLDEVSAYAIDSKFTERSIGYKPESISKLSAEQALFLKNMNSLLDYYGIDMYKDIYHESGGENKDKRNFLQRLISNIPGLDIFAPKPAQASGGRTPQLDKQRAALQKEFQRLGSKLGRVSGARYRQDAASGNLNFSTAASEEVLIAGWWGKSEPQEKARAAGGNLADTLDNYLKSTIPSLRLRNVERETEGKYKGYDILSLDLMVGDKVINSFQAVSGQDFQADSTQKTRHISDIQAPLPDGTYDVSHTIPGQGPGVGPNFIPVTYQGQTKRTALGIHPDYNLTGTSGCIGLISDKDMPVVMDFIEQYTKDGKTIKLNVDIQPDKENKPQKQSSNQTGEEKDRGLFAGVVSDMDPQGILPNSKDITTSSSARFGDNLVAFNPTTSFTSSSAPATEVKPPVKVEQRITNPEPTFSYEEEVLLAQATTTVPPIPNAPTDGSPAIKLSPIPTTDEGWGLPPEPAPAQATITPAPVVTERTEEVTPTSSNKSNDLSQIVQGGTTGAFTGTLAPLFNLIMATEAGGGGWDSTYPSTTMTAVHGKHAFDTTIGEILSRGDSQKAAGMFQFIPSTLRDTAAAAGISLDTKFTQETQTRLAVVLLQTQGRDFWNYIHGRHSDQGAAINALAGIWAAFSNTSGKGSYDNDGRNKASVNLDKMKDTVDRIRKSVLESGITFDFDPEGQNFEMLASGGGGVGQSAGFLRIGTRKAQQGRHGPQGVRKAQQGRGLQMGQRKAQQGRAVRGMRGQYVPESQTLFGPGWGGTGGGAIGAQVGNTFKTGLVTGPNAFIGSGTDYHQHLQFYKGTVEERVAAFDQIAAGYAALGYRVSLISGAGDTEWTSSLSAQRKAELIQLYQSRHAKRSSASLDYMVYGPDGASTKGIPVDILAPMIGGASYKIQNVNPGGGKGIYAYDANNDPIYRIIHGDTRYGPAAGTVITPGGGNLAPTSAPTVTKPKSDTKKPQDDLVSSQPWHSLYEGTPRNSIPVDNSEYKASLPTTEDVKAARLNQGGMFDTDAAASARAQKEYQDSVALAAEVSQALEEVAIQAVKEVEKNTPEPITGMRLELSGDTAVNVSQQERKVNRNSIKVTQTTRRARFEADEKVLYVDNLVESKAVQGVVAGAPADISPPAMQPRVNGFCNA